MTGRIKSMALRSLRCFDNVEFELDGGATLFTGPNGSGKTSVFTGLTWGLAGLWDSTGKVKGAKAIIKDGAKSSEATITFGDDSAYGRRVSASGKTVTKGDWADLKALDAKLLGVAMGGEAFMSSAARDQAALLLRVAGVKVTSEAVSEALGENAASVPKQLLEILDGEADGVDRVEKEARKQRQDQGTIASARQDDVMAAGAPSRTAEQLTVLFDTADRAEIATTLGQVASDIAAEIRAEELDSAAGSGMRSAEIEAELSTLKGNLGDEIGADCSREVTVHADGEEPERPEKPSNEEIQTARDWFDDAHAEQVTKQEEAAAAETTLKNAKAPLSEASNAHRAAKQTALDASKRASAEECLACKQALPKGLLEAAQAESTEAAKIEAEALSARENAEIVADKAEEACVGTRAALKTANHNREVKGALLDGLSKRVRVCDILEQITALEEEQTDVGEEVTNPNSQVLEEKRTEWATAEESLNLIEEEASVENVRAIRQERLDKAQADYAILDNLIKLWLPEVRSALISEPLKELRDTANATAVRMTGNRFGFAFGLTPDGVLSFGLTTKSGRLIPPSEASESERLRTGYILQDLFAGKLGLEFLALDGIDHLDADGLQALMAWAVDHQNRQVLLFGTEGEVMDEQAATFAEDDLLKVIRMNGSGVAEEAAA